MKASSFPLSDDTVEQVTQGMYGVVNEPDGTTSGLVKLKNIEFCGKTGTAQTMGFDLQNRLGKQLKENGWFVGYAPRRNPEIVVAALVQKGGWGSTSAAPIVRDVVKAYYYKKYPQLEIAAAPEHQSSNPRRPARCPRGSPSVNEHVHDFDWLLLAIVGAICAMGVAEIYSSTHASGMAGMQYRQLVWIGVGLIGMFLISRVDYHTLLDQALPLYVFGIIILVIVLGIGHSRFGAKRWVSLGGGFNLQVSELMKLIIIIVLARYFSEVRTDRLSLADLAKVALLTLVPVGLILKQPDLGTAMVLVPVLVMGAILAGIEWKHAAVGVVLLGLLIPVAWHLRTHLKPYQQQRIETFLHPEEDQRGAGYQILQSQIAVGSGGFWGKGFGKGSQNQLGFVPVRYSDFILAALAEEQGFIGVCVVLLLYLGLILRLVDNAQKAKDKAGMYVVMGVTAILGFHVLVNASMVIGYMPVTGIPLPLMSYGGSATAFVFLALGLVMNVRMGRFVN